MCGRYYIEDDLNTEEIRKMVAAINRRSDSRRITASGEIRPTDVVPVVASSRARRPSAFAMSWGYSLPDGSRIINARSETAQSRRIFQDGMLQRRCAIPASGYFEWERAREKKKYAIRPAAEGLMYMAGVYRIENGLPVFAILTRTPADSIAFIHERMPVILPADSVSDWIDPSRRADDLLQNAVLDVVYRRIEVPAWEQIGMEL